MTGAPAGRIWEHLRWLLRHQGVREPRTWLLVGLSLVLACVSALSVVLIGGQASPATARFLPSRASSTAPADLHYVFPVEGRVSYARTHLDYPASDVIASCGAPVRAVADGVVLELSRTDHYDPAVDDGATRGGLFVSILGDDGVRYYGSHLSQVAAVTAGERVRAGQVVGKVGRTGHAGACHLHFGISPPCARAGDWWIRRGVIWPWSYLDSWRQGGARSPVAEITAWSASHGCPATP